VKKFVAICLTLILVLSLPVVALADPGQNPNQNPGAPEMTVGDYTVRVTGGGSNLRIDILREGEIVYPSVQRYGQGTFTQSFTTTSGKVLLIQVQGNSLVNVSVKPPSEPCPPAPPYIVEQYSFRQFVRLNQVDSIFISITEVEGSREFVNGNAVMYNWIRTNQIPGVSGMGVITGARITGTLLYEYVRNYLEQFERVYQWVDVTIWSDGTREEVVRSNSEHVYGDLQDGETYYTGPYSGSRAIVVSGGNVVLHMGFQGGIHDRNADVTIEGFTVNFRLLNTGNPPSMIITIMDVNLDDL